MTDLPIRKQCIQRSQPDFQAHLTSTSPHYTFPKKMERLVPRKPHGGKGQETEDVD